MRKFFITGTDTGIGKTWVSLLVMDALARAGYSVAGCKPLACGIDPGSKDPYTHEDALALQARSSMPLPYTLVNPICLKEPTAPGIAADMDGCLIELAAMLKQTNALITHLHQHANEQALALVCEGVGGWDVPINAKESMADFACLLDADIILVVGLQLGCLNHARLSYRTIIADLQRHQCATNRLIGFVINQVEPDTLHARQYIDALKSALAIPLLAVVSHGGSEAIELTHS